MKTFSALAAIYFSTTLCYAESPKDQVMNALLCKGDSLELIRSVVKAHPFDSGVASTTWGDEMDEKNLVIIQGGISIAGASTQAVRTQFESEFEDFQGLVFAEFTGDYQPVIKELGLAEAKGKSDTRIGKFILPRPSGKNDEVCPPTIALTPLADNRFVLGCGWCNG